MSGPSQTFLFDRTLSAPFFDFTKDSHFVLYENGAFVLQFFGRVVVEYRGRYTEADGDVIFEWEGWSVAGPWGATGSLSGDALSVRYNIIMQMSDFEDGVYRRER